MNLLTEDGSALLMETGDHLLWADAASSGCKGSVGIIA